MVNGRAKINDLNARALLQHDILWLQISVHYSLRMHVADRLENLLDNIGGISFAEALTLHNLVEEFPTFAQFGDKVERAHIHEHFVQLDNVGVVKVLSQPHLIDELIKVFLVAPSGLLDLLHSSNRARLYMPARGDNPKSALAEAFDDLVVVLELFIADEDKVLHIQVEIIDGVHL